MHQRDTISHESAIVVLKSTDRLALTGVGPPSTFGDRTGDRTGRNGAVKADLTIGGQHDGDFFADIVLGDASDPILGYD